ncbi:hypothetical protein O181_058379 [Austropuccinia psidii MF-1]|uniref:Uncharacterized protein n=1 Tax=Austropuccinia psidii MF-1 TaxID=1389203 RepID=A0A9Q3HXK9_9BASI|nr:hypothetical protein [Austropuccinia psidii MF-1]
MELTIIQSKNQKDKGMAQQKEGGKQRRSPSGFYQKASSQPTSPGRKKKQEKELEETILPQLQDTQNPKRCHGKFFKHGQKFDGIKEQRGTENETTIFTKAVILSPDFVNNLSEIENSILPLKEIKNSLL